MSNQIYGLLCHLNVHEDCDIPAECACVCHESGAIRSKGERYTLVERLQAENARLYASNRELVQALESIAKHPHNDYDHPTNGGGNYGTGCADGHRCAANVAQTALDKLQAVAP